VKPASWGKKKKRERGEKKRGPLVLSPYLSWGKRASHARGQRKRKKKRKEKEKNVPSASSFFLLFGEVWSTGDREKRGGEKREKGGEEEGRGRMSKFHTS